MESSVEQLLNKLADQQTTQLTIYEEDELVWLVALLFTEEFYGKNNLHLFYSQEKHTAYFKKVSDFVQSHKDAKKLLAKIKGELIYDDGEEKPQNEDLHRVKSLDFFYWAEAHGCQIPQKIVDGLKWLMQMDYDRKQRAAEEKRKFPELPAEKFALLRKEPLWALDKAVLYVNGICSEVKPNDVIEYIKRKPALAKLCLYITQAYSSRRLNVVEHELTMEWVIKPNEISYTLIERSSVEPEQFISFIKMLPLAFPMLEEKSTVQIKTNKYQLSTKDTNTLFKLIAGMATKGYGYDLNSSKNPATSDIQTDTGVTAKTAKKWIDKAIEIRSGLQDDEDA